MKNLEKALSVEQLEERFEMAVAPGPQSLGCSCFGIHIGRKVCAAYWETLR